MTAPSLHCPCCCHSASLGDAHEALHHDRIAEAAAISMRSDFERPPVVKTDDPLEAAVAQGCSCLKRHAVALSGEKKPRPPYKPPKPWSPEEDAA